ncbi:hypothetical protein N7497_005779 [Penicillium chrysogenum]|nr:hypothetical protein N7497_005779 [Penicillium chrysogenum]
MAEIQVLSSFEDETAQPPGTFKLIRGEVPFLSCVGVFIDSYPVPDDGADEHGQHSVVLDPISLIRPQRAPSEPALDSYLPIDELIPTYIHE